MLIIYRCACRRRCTRTTEPPPRTRRSTRVRLLNFKDPLFLKPLLNFKRFDPRWAPGSKVHLLWTGWSATGKRLGIGLVAPRERTVLKSLLNFKNAC
jgi:hypothetical protein